MLRLTADREVADSTSDAASVAASTAMAGAPATSADRTGRPLQLHDAPAPASEQTPQTEPVSIGVVAPASPRNSTAAADVRAVASEVTPAATGMAAAVPAGLQEDSSVTLPAEFGVISELLRVAQRMRSALNQELADSGLNEVRLTVMQVLHSSPAGCSQSELADALQQSESSVSTLVERMRTDGLLYRLRSSSDRRKRVLMLTAEGRDRLDQVHATHGPRIGELLAGLAAGDIPQLQQLLAAVDAGLDGQSLQVPMTPSAQSKPSAA